MDKLIDNPEKMEIAIDIAQAFQGKNFLTEPILRESFIKQIEVAIRSYCDPDVPEYKNKSWVEIDIDDDNDKKIGSICFTETEIYAKKSNNTPIPEYQIRCDNINDQNLINLLTKNTEGINEWLRQVYELF